MGTMTVDEARQTREWYDVADKAPWGEGPWQTEPDKAQWVDAGTGLDCLIVRSQLGALCGYVGVPATHPDYGKRYDDVCDLDVHGGITFAAPCHDDAPDPALAICHVPWAGRPDGVWWFGFDCAHAFDYVPSTAILRQENPQARRWEGEVYRDVAYVRAECAILAAQLAARVAHD